MKSDWIVGHWLVFAVLLGTACLPDPDISVPDRTPTAMPMPMPPAPSVCEPTEVALDKIGHEAGKVLNPTLRLRDAQGEFTIQTLHEPCAEQTNLVVLRLMTSWCGPCRWHMAHTEEILKAGAPGRVQVIDVLVRNQSNISTPTVTSFDEIKPYYDTLPRLALENGPTLIGYFEINLNSKYRLPLVSIINRKTMQLVDILPNPDPDQLVYILRQELARADGLPAPPNTSPPLYDGRFSRDRWEMIQKMRLPMDWQPPLDPTNRYENNSDAAALGRALFFDESLTSVGTIGCVTCHSPTKAFADGRKTAQGLLPDGTTTLGDRNTPWLGGIAASRFLFWDSRVDSLWAQALGPFENDREMSSNRLYVIRESLKRYGASYAKVFGAPPDLSDTMRFPLNARPGMAAWDGMTTADRDTVNRIYANLGKAIAAYERQIRPLPVAIDRYAAGDQSALTSDEKDGLVRFFEVGCPQCHYGPMLSDDTPHDNYFPTGRQDGIQDVGRLTGLPAMLANDFRSDGPYSDNPQAAAWLRGLSSDVTTRGQFRTMSLRGIADTAPYTHGGVSQTLEELVTLYATAGLPDGDERTTGARDISLMKFDKDDPRNQLLVP